ncbi:hypothetical protein IGI04_005735 [Brassica rapa subsp. trilocularis]|uniref:Uncharacterized protein n=1 Tax=Brassica rapa subsp. trilocularis TaxID=1813537 RepID=A0ABQ7NGX5_BRACM|nr:hypothetical protein IGI04_005735 [Brassica rapa subsp. trilocularis]
MSGSSSREALCGIRGGGKDNGIETQWTSGVNSGGISRFLESVSLSLSLSETIKHAIRSQNRVIVEGNNLTNARFKICSSFSMFLELEAGLLFTATAVAYWNYFIRLEMKLMVANSKRDCLVDLAFLLSLQNELWSENHLVVQLILLFWYPASVEEEDYFAVWHCWKYRELQAARCGSIQGQCAYEQRGLKGWFLCTCSSFTHLL